MLVPRKLNRLVQNSLLGSVESLNRDYVSTRGHPQIKIALFSFIRNLLKSLGGACLQGAVGSVPSDCVGRGFSNDWNEKGLFFQ